MDLKELLMETKKLMEIKANKLGININIFFNKEGPINIYTDPNRVR